MFTQKDRVELEAVCAMDTDLTVGPQPRWKRRQLRAQQQNGEENNSCELNNDSRTPLANSSQSHSPQADRFIPNRKAMNFDVAGMSRQRSADENKNSDGSNEENEGFKNALASSLLDSNGDTNSSTSEEDNHRVLAFKDKAPTPCDGYQNNLRVLYSQNRGITQRAKSVRQIPSGPERVLDAPSINDNFYLNLIDWSCNNVLAVALDQAVYLWNASSGNITELTSLDSDDDFITSVSWIPEGGGYLAVGTESSVVQLWDCNALKRVRTMRGHSARVGSLAWNNHILSSGSRDCSIMNHDVRIRDHHVSTFSGHQQEVCGLKWNPDGSMLASGSNDNNVCIWDYSKSAPSVETAPKHTLASHQAAVKALAWCPWQRNVLASGGGTGDRTIKFWNTANGALLNSINTEAQVSGLVWNPHEREIVSSHGFSRNSLCVWKYPSMVMIKELQGHTARVLGMVPGADGSSVCSVGADETLRFWKVFGEPKKGKAGNENSLSSSVLQNCSIR